MYQIVISKDALKKLRKMPRNVAKTILDKLDDLALDPFAENNNVKKLVNRDGYRLRIGDWRVIYIVDDDIIQIHVIKIAPRGEVYED